MSSGASRSVACCRHFPASMLRIGHASRPGPVSRPIRPPWRRGPASLHGTGDQPPRLLRHGVLAAELAAQAPARRRPPAPDRTERRQRQYRGHRRASRARRDRDRQRRRIEKVPDRPAEHQEYHQDEHRHPARGPGVTDHGRPLFASAPSRVGRAPLPVHFLDPSANGKSQGPASPGAERSVITASSAAASASPADR